ncbi:UNKNOWN [Stylonychia lemnae]|uniref:Large ribosomal subunit protein mL43 n=1 Tax=Stylonychia lemnae TaxID=5949 RepID=A0A078A1N1_STYLE|nr:UNKNOWN [Stylonychia lemnae]|eukprot:CDW76166.1 UNKNOWN [Stylonychia lemnae]
MVSRGVHQLKNLRLYFCDFGGSSLGVRDFLKSQELADFVNQNEHLKVEVFMRRNHHPYISATYINGFVKDQPLRNLPPEEILDQLERQNNTFGRSSTLLKHNSIKVNGNTQSVQGKWNNNTWNRFPQHQMETFKLIPRGMIDPPQLIPVQPKKKPDYLTAFMRKKSVLPKYNINS